MVERLSMWSQVQRARYLATAVCPNVACEETNTPGRKPMIELEDTQAYCNTCGTSWDPHLPRPQAL